MARKSQSPKKNASDIPPDMPADVRRRDVPQAPDAVSDSSLLPETAGRTDVPGVSPSEDGGVAEHPIHDEDFNDNLDSEDYESMIDEVEKTGIHQD